MSNFEKLFQNDSSRGVAIGAGAVLIGLAAIPALIMAGRPIARVAIKSGILALERGREAMAIASESLDDLVAEVRSELVMEHRAEAESSEDAHEDKSIKGVG